MDPVNLVCLVLGATVLTLSLAAEALRRFVWLSEPAIATAIGFTVGPSGYALLVPADWGDDLLLLKEVARMTLAVALMGAALRLPTRWLRQHWRPLAMLILLGMPLMWMSTSLCAWWVLELSVLHALLFGALFAPTDPVLAGTIVSGELAERHVDADTRHLISAESGANDGLALLFVMVPVLLIEHSTADAVAHWTFKVLGGEVLASTVAGVVVGWTAGRILCQVPAFDRNHHGSLLSVSVALALALLGGVRMLHGDGLLAVFAAGVMFRAALGDAHDRHAARHQHIQQAITRFFDVPVFMLFGMLLPTDAWASLGPAPWLFAACVLVARRLPAILLLRPWLGLSHGFREALFVGWFGPIGVAALLYTTWADERLGYSALWPVGSLMVLASIAIHGITATPLTKCYGRLLARSRAAPAA